jgi:hypothetical protein
VSSRTLPRQDALKGVMLFGVVGLVVCQQRQMM